MLSDDRARHISPVPLHRTLALPAALVMHGLVLVTLTLLLLAPQPYSIPQPTSIAAEIVTPEQYRKLLTPPQSAPKAPNAIKSSDGAVPEVPLEKAEADPHFRPATDGMTAAQHFHANEILAAPENAFLRQGLGQMGNDERAVQLCNIEAVEQLRLADAAEAPDAVVGYAFGDIAIKGSTLVAEGGAFRSAGQWFHLSYRCSATPDYSGVSRFEFSVGALVPKSQWEEHFLNADDDWLN